MRMNMTQKHMNMNQRPEKNVQNQTNYTTDDKTAGELHP